MISQILLIIYLIACSCFVMGIPDDLRQSESIPLRHPQQAESIPPRGHQRSQSAPLRDLQRSESAPPRDPPQSESVSPEYFQQPQNVRPELESCLPRSASDPSMSRFTVKGVTKKFLRAVPPTASNFLKKHVFGYGRNPRLDSDNNCFVQYQLSAKSWTNIQLEPKWTLLPLPPPFQSTGRPRLLIFLYPQNKVPEVEIRYSWKVPGFGTSNKYATLDEASVGHILLDEPFVTNKKLYLVYNPSQFYLYLPPQDDGTRIVYFDIENAGVSASDYSRPRVGGATLAEIFTKISSTLYTEDFRTSLIDWPRIHSLPQYADLKGDYTPKDKELRKQATEIAKKMSDVRLWLQNNIDIEGGDVDGGSVDDFPVVFPPLIPFTYIDGLHMQARLSRQPSYEISKEFRGSKDANAAVRSSAPPSMGTTRILTTNWQLVDDGVKKLSVESGKQIHIIVRIKTPVGIKVHVDLSNKQPGPVYASDFVQDSYLVPQEDDYWCLAFPLRKDLVKRTQNSDPFGRDFLPIYYRISIMEPGNGPDLQDRDDLEFVTPGSSPPRLTKAPTKSWRFTPSKKGGFIKAIITNVFGKSTKAEFTKPVHFTINYSFGVPLFPEAIVMNDPNGMGPVLPMKPAVAAAAAIPQLQSQVIRAAWLGVVTSQAYKDYLDGRNKRIPDLAQVRQRRISPVEAVMPETEQMSPDRWTEGRGTEKGGLNRPAKRIESERQGPCPINNIASSSDRAQRDASDLDRDESGQGSGRTSYPFMDAHDICPR